jgi:hypothetical protein
MVGIKDGKGFFHPADSRRISNEIEDGALSIGGGDLRSPERPRL